MCVGGVSWSGADGWNKNGCLYIEALDNYNATNITIIKVKKK